MDALSQLRSAITLGKEIKLISADGTTTKELQGAKSLCIVPDDLVFPLTQETNYRYSVDPDAFYTLGTVYFAYLNKDAEHVEYFKECRRVGVPSVTLIYKKDLFSYLTGESDQSSNIVQSYSAAKGVFELVITCMVVILIYS